MRIWLFNLGHGGTILVDYGSDTVVLLLYVFDLSIRNEIGFCYVVV